MITGVEKGETTLNNKMHRGLQRINTDECFTRLHALAGQEAASQSQAHED